MAPISARFRPAFTLVEIVAVVAIIAILACVAVRSVGFLADKARTTAAESDLAAIRDAFVGEPDGYLADMRGIPGFSVGHLRIANLLIATNVYGRAEGSDTGERLDRDGGTTPRGCASAAELTRWSEERRRGWRGPYLRSASLGDFPSRDAVRFAGDSSGEGRGFYPDLAGLLVPSDFKNGYMGCSVYGFPGEPCALDPWGNPYVLQIPPPQAFGGAMTNVTDEIRWRYARVVSAGPDGVLSTPCFEVNATNVYSTSWTPRKRRMSRQAGLVDANDRSARGDDLVLFIGRNDVDEGEDNSL